MLVNHALLLYCTLLSVKNDNKQIQRSLSYKFYCQEYAATKNGTFLRKLESKELFFFSCFDKHRFLLNKAQISRDIWCLSCAKTYQLVKEHVELNKGTLLTNNPKPVLLIKCLFGHEWNVKMKRANNSWCRICGREEKKELKNLIKRENEKVEFEKMNIQVD